MLRRTPLFDKHLALGAKIVPFAGWEMPLSYKSVVAEHQAVRNNAGIFDVSHMGRITLQGKNAKHVLDYLSTNRILDKQDGQATYTLWCNPLGGTIDDLIAYQETEDSFFVVANASNREKDFQHLTAHTERAIAQPVYEKEGILAIQGPQALALAQSIFPELLQLKSMHFVKTTFQGIPLYIAATGYTGEKGFEVYAPQEILPELWDRFIAAGITPVGLGARDTLRLEMGYALYGHELKEDRSPLESIAAWAVKMDKDFLGKDALEAYPKYFPVALAMAEGGIPREGYSIKQKGEILGEVTSGTFSPSLNQGIALGRLKKNVQEGEPLAVEIRGKEFPADCVKLPFWRKK